MIGTSFFMIFAGKSRRWFVVIGSISLLATAFYGIALLGAECAEGFSHRHGFHFAGIWLGCDFGWGACRCLLWKQATWRLTFDLGKAPIAECRQTH